MPVEVVGLEIGEYGVSGFECMDIVGHETGNLQYDISVFEPFFPDGPHGLAEWDFKVPGEKYPIFSVLLFQEIVEDPCGRGFSVRPGYGKDFEPLRKVPVDEIKLSHDLSGRIDPVRRCDTGRGDNGVVGAEILNIIGIVPDDSRDSE